MDNKVIKESYEITSFNNLNHKLISVFINDYFNKLIIHLEKVNVITAEEKQKINNDFYKYLKTYY